MSSELTQIVNDPLGQMTAVLSSLTKEKASFTLCLAATETSDVEGISAAGATPALRRLTPATDAEALLLGATRSSPRLPVSPLGIVSPVVITRACLKLTAIHPLIVDCGSFTKPQVPYLDVGGQPARSVSSGRALPLTIVKSLFENGYRAGSLMDKADGTVMIAECVPGGTTTALAVLTALGYDAKSALSSSLPISNHVNRFELVQMGLERAQLKQGNCFEIIAAVGDPMQPFAAGMCLGASSSNNVILAGGSMMLAVYALAKIIGESMSIDLKSRQIGVITTKWVAFDPTASLSTLSQAIAAPFAAACPNFLLSKHEGLRAYEAGNVKEGVGAGAAMALAHKRMNLDECELMVAIDACYDDLVTLPPNNEHELA